MLMYGHISKDKSHFKETDLILVDDLGPVKYLSKISKSSLGQHQSQAPIPSKILFQVLKDLLCKGWYQASHVFIAGS